MLHKDIKQLQNILLFPLIFMFAKVKHFHLKSLLKSVTQMLIFMFDVMSNHLNCY